ncbi:hypothetical protein DPMN_145191 [Dreissena polymorpha]|uniref:AIG1-type G domain-containing protein n=1 Tax=Dreissena polymorpha TaxID=45954 RepID=A0A9D4F9E2_DREPO|nr:hypothetical protein DPMN_145191 [Dreissena polymorpha]
MSDSINETTVVLFGPFGHGKSLTGNTLLGRQEFKKQLDVSIGRSRSTSQIEKATCCRIIGRRYFELEIVDTPGLFQSRNVAETALKLLQVTDLKPHVFVLVLRSYKLTKDEQHTTDMLRLVFGDRVFERTIIIVTHADEFESEHELVDLMKMFDDGKTLLQLCRNRIMLIDNVKKRFDFDKFRVFIDRISQCGRFVYDLDYSLTRKMSFKIV